MDNQQSTKGELLREATANLRGMVAETHGGTLTFRTAHEGEKPLNRYERRRIGQYFELGLSDLQIAGVLSSW